MNVAKHRFGIIAVVVMALATWGGLLLLKSHTTDVPSFIRDPVEFFVAPGVTVWWFVLGGPFRNLPRSAGDIALAASANAMLWWLAGRSVVALARILWRR